MEPPASIRRLFNPVAELPSVQFRAMFVCTTTNTPSPPEPQGDTPVLHFVPSLARPLPVLRLKVAALAKVTSKINRKSSVVFTASPLSVLTGKLYFQVSNANAHTLGDGQSVTSAARASD